MSVVTYVHVSHYRICVSLLKMPPFTVHVCNKYVIIQYTLIRILRFKSTSSNKAFDVFFFHTTDRMDIVFYVHAAQVINVFT